jgi:hypothetical protein
VFWDVSLGHSGWTSCNLLLQRSRGGGESQKRRKETEDARRARSEANERGSDYGREVGKTNCFCDRWKLHSRSSPAVQKVRRMDDAGQSLAAG